MKASVGLLRVRTLKLGIFRNWYIVRTSRQIPNLLADPYWADPTKTEDHFLQHKKFDVNTLAPKQWVSSVSTLSALRPLPYVQKGSEQKQQEGLSTFMVHQVCGPGYSTLLIHHIINNPDKINPLCHGYTWIIKVPPIISLSAPRLAKSKRPSEDSGLRKKRGWSASHACQKHIVPEWCKRLL